MREYVMRVAGAAVLLGLLEQLLPPNASIRARVRLLSSLCLLLVMLLPAAGGVASLPALFESGAWESEQADEAAYEKILEGTVRETVQSELSAAILKMLAREHGVNAETATVGVSFYDGTPLRVKRVLVTVRGADIFRDPYEMEEAVTALLGCECVVAIG